MYTRQCLPDYGMNPWRMGDDDVRFYVLCVIFDGWAFRFFDSFGAYSSQRKY